MHTYVHGKQWKCMCDMSDMSKKIMKNNVVYKINKDERMAQKCRNKGPYHSDKIALWTESEYCVRIL